MQVMSSAISTILILTIQVGFSFTWQANSFSQLPSGCICPGNELTFTCSIEGPGATVWKGSFINDCFGSTHISLRHNTDFTQYSQTCNNGAVTATALTAKNNNYTSQLRINMTMISLMNGSTITCAHDDYNVDEERIVDTWTMIDPPMNLRLEDASRESLSFCWNTTYLSCPSLHYDVRTINCGTCPTKVGSNTAVCDDFKITADIQVCSIAIQRRCGENIAGNTSDIFQVFLKVPEAPRFTHQPSYYWIHDQSEDVLRLNVTINETVAFNVSNNIDGSATSYTIQYSDSMSSTGCNDSVVIPASSCRHSVCNHVFEIANSSCSLSADVIVTAFATNVLGDGRRSITRAALQPEAMFHKIGIIIGGVTVTSIVMSIVIFLLTIGYCCYRRKDHHRIISSYIVEFYIEPRMLAQALQIFTELKIELDFVHDMDTSAPLPNMANQELKGFYVSYDCLKRTSDNAVSQLKAAFGEANVVIVGEDEDQTHKLAMQFSRRDQTGEIARITKLFMDLGIDIVTMNTEICSDSVRSYTIECLCSNRKKKIIRHKLKLYGVINLTIKEKVSLPQQIDGTECAVVKFQNDDELGSYHGVVTSISTIKNFAEDKYNLCHVNMSIDEDGKNNIYFICTYPIEMSEQLRRDIETALPGRTIQIQPVVREQNQVAIELDDM